MQQAEDPIGILRADRRASSLSTDSHPSEGAAGIRRFLRIAFRQAWIVVACVLVTAAVAGEIEHRRETKRYTAGAQLLLRANDASTALPGSSVPFSDPTRARATDLQLITVPTVANGVAREIHNGMSPGALSGMVSTSASGDSDLISVTAQASTPQLAAQVANAFADVYVRFRRVADRQRFAEAIHIASVDLTRALRTPAHRTDVPQLRAQLDRLRLFASLETADAQVVSRADPRRAGVSASKWKRIAGAGALLGLVLGIILAGLRERLDDRVRTEEEIQALLVGLPILASVPSVRARRKRRKAAVANAFRDLRDVVDTVVPPTASRSLLVTSSQDRDGKSTTALNLALAVSEAAGADSVLLVDADLQQPDLTRRLGLSVDPRRPSLPVLATHEQLAEHIVEASVTPTRAGRAPHVALAGQLPVLPSLPPAAGSAPRFDDSSATASLRQTAQRARTVIVDGPPLGTSADMLAVARHASGVIVAVRLGHTRRRTLERLTERLAVAGIEPIGVVVLRSSPHAPRH
ncbi:MAG: capsular exopolysaccharide family [Solirubrobacteraceae bacterium]|nr:capsular exopolysaccharide family [Solirubrobacteraceae bacterium]